MQTNRQKTIEEYKSRINRVMDYIESNISEPFTLDELSDIANFSKYHFHRIFYSIVGETLFNFIQRIRLERSAQLIAANPSKSITDIALDCGFTSSAMFSRSFRKRFSITPTEWRNKKNLYENIREDEAGSCNNVFAGGNPKEPLEIEKRLRGVEIRQFDEKALAYVRYIGPYAGDADLFEKLSRKLFRWASPRKLIGPDTEFLIIYHDDIGITDKDLLRTSVCITVPDGTTADGEIGRLNLPAADYVCASFLLGTKDYGEAWAWVYSRWLPESGYMPDDAPCFEYYPPAEKSGTGETLVDICVPVVPL